MFFCLIYLHLRQGVFKKWRGEINSIQDFHQSQHPWGKGVVLFPFSCTQFSASHSSMVLTEGNRNGNKNATNHDSSKYNYKKTHNGTRLMKLPHQTHKPWLCKTQWSNHIGMITAFFWLQTRAEVGCSIWRNAFFPPLTFWHDTIQCCMRFFGTLATPRTLLRHLVSTKWKGPSQTVNM